MASQKQLDYDSIVEKARKCVPPHGDCISLEDLATLVDVPRTSLARALRGIVKPSPGESLYSAFAKYVAGTTLDTELASLTEQLSHYKRLANRYEKDLGNRQAWFDELREIVSVLQTSPVPVPKAKKDAKRTEHVAFLKCSDWHYGADTARGEPLGVFPVYNPTISKQAINALFERTVSLVSHWDNYMDVVAFVVSLEGDLVEHGFLRKGHRGRVAFGPPRQVIELAQILYANIQMLASEYPVVKVTCVGGNHGRSDPQPGAGLPSENYDWLIGQILKMLFVNQPNVEVIVPDCWYVLHRIWETLVFSFHGEDIRSWASVPWYGVARAVSAINAMLTQETKERLRALDRQMTLTVDEFLRFLLIPDVVSLGHFHTPWEVKEMGVNVIENGALIGVTEYSAKRPMRIGMPSQKLVMFSKKYRLPVLAPDIFIDDIVRMQGEGIMPLAPIMMVV